VKEEANDLLEATIELAIAEVLDSLGIDEVLT